jgi:hypothetical protein
MMTGSAGSTATTCSVSGIWKGKNNTNVAFYVEVVDALGNPTVYSATVPLTLSVSGGLPATVTVPATATSTSPNTVTATLTSQTGTTTVKITGGGYTLTVLVTA